MKLMMLQTENVNKFVEVQTDNLSKTTGVTKRVPPVFAASTPDILYSEIRAVQLHWALQRVVHRRQWFEEARSSATGRTKLMIETYISTVLGGLEEYKKWFAEGTKEFWEEHWEGLLQQMKENSGAKADPPQV